ncbi:C40 family peptidase [Bacillus thuringiensis]|uniref:C40 family peptidase n=1 Tax=Bacillus thuringiensis TaxID=1428 RepID=UPI0021D654B1|nr:NlpC/P60 family protein [Bacillus thuringiensis]MCU7667644.1 NlpC/P60 family protein [Bacillus thuringiensis]
MKKLSMKAVPFLLAAVAFAGTSQTAEASTDYGNRLIKQVTRGNDVIKVQKDLKDLNIYTTSGVDGIYGPISKKAIIKFQQNEGILVDGIVGPQTKQHLSDVMDSKTSNSGVRTQQPVKQAAAQPVQQETQQPAQQEVQPDQQEAQPVQQAVQQPETEIVVEQPVQETQHTEQASAVQDSSMGQRMVAHALNDIGIPYVWGGNTHSGFDCSGFVLHLLKEQGITGLPRNSADIYNHGTYVDRGNLQAGDVVFFKNTYRPGISHLGIYIGNNEFVHAGDNGVQKSSLDNSYFAPRYAGAKRF